MEAFYSWIKGIAFYIILVTTVMYVLPNQKYQKYLRFFTGIVMILLVINPILKVLKQDQNLSYTFQLNNYRQELDEFNKDIKEAQGEQKHTLLTQYEEKIAEKISEFVAGQGLFTKKISVILNSDETSENYGSIQSIQIEASRSEVQQDKNRIETEDIQIGSKKQKNPSVEEINLKNEIEDFYNISGDNINISIQG